MVVEDFRSFSDWLLTDGALLTFAYVTAFCAVVGLMLGFIVSSFRHGPAEAFYAVSQTVFQAVPDVLGLKFRRIWAIARLAIKENFRLFVVTLAIFVIALGVAGWFIGGGGKYPERSYVAFLFFMAQILVSIFAVLVSAFSLPNDILSKTIYTVVTKPVRASEIVLGRFVGFALLGTVLLSVVGGLSYVFMVRGIDHTHELSEDITSDKWLPIVDGFTPDGRRPFDPRAIFESSVLTSRSNDHVHRLAVVVLDDGSTEVIADEVAGHTHAVEIVELDPDTQRPKRVRFGPPRGNLRSRQPIYSRERGDLPALSLTDETGAENMGINVGEVWDYHKYIQGGTQATATFRFSGLTPARFNDMEDINLDLNLAVFRTHLGDIRRRVEAEIEFRNVVDLAETETAQIKSVKIPFETEEFKVQTLKIPRKLKNGTIKASGQADLTNQELDFFEDLAANGELDLVIRCVDQKQYIGVARASVYFHAGDTSFGWNYLRGFTGIWAQMLAIVALSIALSTFLKGPVVLIGSVGVIVFGYSAKFILFVADSVLSGNRLDNIWGGGPSEALYRLVTQMNLQHPMPPGVGTNIIKFVDANVLLPGMKSLSFAVPRFENFNFSNYLAYGYTIDNQVLMINLLTAFTFAVGMMVIGYFCFKTREIAAA
jgi:ABC-type transport system involved in multi-copper enzyme maturation permease subunit